jgi:choline dehydrogenase-like flavoprotein
MPFVPENHGTSGPVRTSFGNYRLAIEDDIIKACDEVTGRDMKPVDPWSGDHIGFFNTLGSVVRTGPDRGKRSYAARGYLGQSESRPNLKVLCNALVSRVHGGTEHSVPVSGEVIVCGGAINSPQILELSGIGDPEVLRAAGVECKVELPSVGNNFQDHTVTYA